MPIGGWWDNYPPGSPYQSWPYHPWPIYPPFAPMWPPKVMHCACPHCQAGRQFTTTDVTIEASDHT